jgi:hypothetical protein
MFSTETYLILATFAGPIIAVQTQKWIERANERRLAHRRIFYALMATRAMRASVEHVQALNMIDLEFQGPWWRPQTPGEKKRHRTLARICGPSQYRPQTSERIRPDHLEHQVLRPLH